MRAGDRAAVQMITADDNGCADLARGDQIIESQACLVPLTVAEPADAGRQALEADLVASTPQPLLQSVVAREQLHHRPVGDLDIARVARQRHPAERAFALAEQWPDVSRHEARELESTLIATQSGFVANRVAIVEDLGTGILELHHRLHVTRHAGP